MCFIAPVSSIILVDELNLLSKFVCCNIFAILWNVVDVFLFNTLLFFTWLHLHALGWNNSVQDIDVVMIDIVIFFG